MSMATDGPDLVLENATLWIPLGRITSAAGQLDLRSVHLPAPPNGIPLQVFPVRSLTVVGKLLIRSSQPTNAPAVAFAVHGDVQIDGAVSLLGSGPDDQITVAPPGSISTGPCVGAVGTYNADGQPAWGAGGGGGGGATQGGAGGSHWKWAGSAGGAAFPNPDLQPLRGGCQGGSPLGEPPAHGGGAIQITSRTRIRLGANASITANGSVGFVILLPPGEPPGLERAPRGGGSGGGILLEAPAVLLDDGVVLAAIGGAGASGDGAPGTPTTGRVPSLGGACTAPASYCTNGGDGGSSAGPGRSAASIATTNLDEVYTGAGGGAAGHLRINTRDGIYTKASDVVESPSPTTGVLLTR